MSSWARAHHRLIICESSYGRSRATGAKFAKSSKYATTCCSPAGIGDIVDEPELEFSLSQLTDRSLLKRFRTGNQDAATALYLRYAKRLERLAKVNVSRSLAARVDTEDVVQSVFRTFFRRVTQGQYEVGDQEDLWRLLLVMALNKIRSSGTFHRAAKRDIGSTEPLPDHLPETKSRAEGELALNVLKLTIQELVGAMPFEQRSIVLLRIEGYEVQEIAVKTGRAKRSVERILQSFRGQLQNSLNEKT